MGFKMRGKSTVTQQEIEEYAKLKEKFREWYDEQSKKGMGGRFDTDSFVAGYKRALKDIEFHEEIKNHIR